MQRSVLSSFLIASVIVTASTAHAQSVQVVDGPTRRAEAQTGDWSVILGAGVGYGPTIDGSRESEATPAYYVDAIWRNRVQITGDGINLLFGSNRLGQASVGLGYASGINESDDPTRRGLGDIEGGLEARAALTRNIAGLDWTAEATYAFGDSGGTRLNASVSKGWRVTESVSIIGSAGVEWADEDWTQERLGVTPAEAVRLNRSAFKASSGLSASNVSLTAIYSFAGPWFVGAQASYVQLLGDSADSPVSRRDGAASGLIVIGRAF